jgi:hypothetical protein
MDMTRRRSVVLPGTAVNLLRIVNENLVTNFKRGVQPDLSLPPLFERAFNAHNEDTELAFILEFPEE